MLKRELNLSKTHSYFIFGARQTGKTTLVRCSFNEAALKIYNLLLTREYARFAANPGTIREEILALPTTVSHVLIDEVQKVPDILNEIQALIDEGVPQHFILTGSSARKLRRVKANLLGGRAWSFNLFPLTVHELDREVNLSECLSYGTLPLNITTPDSLVKSENLRSYIDVYLKEEIEAEAISRNIGGFIRFLQVAAQANGEQLNYSNVGRDVGMSSVTTKEYFKILDDTLIGMFLFPFAYSERKKHKTSPKFYFFDTGVLRALQGRLSVDVEPRSFEFGNYFETWVINEVVRISSYLRKDLRLSFLRTANNVEVDLIIQTPRDQIYAVEIKSKETPISLDFESGFAAIKKIAPRVRCLCVCTGKSARIVDGYEVLPYLDFFRMVRGL